MQMLCYIDKYCRSNIYNIEYGGYLSNHFSHGVIALGKIGASEARIQSFCDIYKEHEVLGYKLEAPYLDDEILIKDDDQLFSIKGKKMHYLSIVDYLNKQLPSSQQSQTKSIQFLLSKYLNRVLSGMSSTAMHPLISLGYALEIEDLGLVVDSLAYLFYSNIELQSTNEYSKILEQSKLAKLTNKAYNYTINTDFHKHVKNLGLDIQTIFLKVKSDNILPVILSKNLNFDIKTISNTQNGEFVNHILIQKEFGLKFFEYYLSQVIAHRRIESLNRQRLDQALHLPI